jgi:hypothetical protein
MKNDKNKKLLNEIFLVQYSAEKYKKALENDEPIILQGVIQRANAKNKNNRIYPKEILQESIEKYKQEFIQENRALGELDHPESSQEVLFKNASHRINEIWWAGDEVHAKIEILSGKHFPYANILRGCIKNNIPIGFSSRGLGSEVPLNENTYEVEDYDLICWDAVTNPSTHGAFGLLKEGASEEILNKQRRIKERDALITKILSE